MGFFNRIKSNIKAGKVVTNADALYISNKSKVLDVMNKLGYIETEADKMIAAWALLTASRSYNIDDEGISAILMSIYPEKHNLYKTLYFDPHYNDFYRERSQGWVLVNNVLAISYQFFRQSNLSIDILEQIESVASIINQASEMAQEFITTGSK